MRMRFVIAVVLSLVLSPMIASAAAAQEGGGAGDVTVVDCSQVQNVFVDQSASQDQYRGVALRRVIAQDLDLTLVQVNNCLSGGGGGEGDQTPPPDETPPPDQTPAPNDTGDDTDDDGTTDDQTDVADNRTGEDEDVIMPAGLADEELPETGGADVVAVVAGCVLLGAGVLARGLLRRRP